MNEYIYYNQEELEDMILQAEYAIKDAYAVGNSIRVCEIFSEIWPEIKLFIQSYFYQIEEDRIIKPTLEEVDRMSGYRYEFSGWLSEMEVEFCKANLHMERIRYCRELLEIFEKDDFYSDSFKAAIGEAYHYLGYHSECDHYFTSWLALEPHNPHAINVYSLCLILRNDMNEARKIIETYIPVDRMITDETLILFERAEEFYALIGDEAKADEYSNLIQKGREAYQQIQTKEKSYN